MRDFLILADADPSELEDVKKLTRGELLELKYVIRKDKKKRKK